MRIDDSSIRVNRHTCIACGICVDRCIMDNLRFSVAPCRQACPLGMNCQGYIRLIARGEEARAVEQLSSFGPLTALIAETCHAPCERACYRGKKDGPVHILALKRYLARKYPTELNDIIVPRVSSGKRLAIIGAGLAGLACAVRARQSGHLVDLFSPRPSFVDKIARDLSTVAASLEKAGAAFREEPDFNGEHYPLKEYDSIILTKSEDWEHLVPGVLEKVPDVKIDPVSHLIQDNIFSAETELSIRGAVYEIADAFETIESVNRFLNKVPFDWGRDFYSRAGAVREYRPDERVGSPDGRTSTEETAKGFDRETARKQAARCYGCGRAFEKNQTCWYCLPCELECPEEALTVEIPYLVR